MDQPKIALTRMGNSPTENYGQATIHWLASKAASGARELTFGITSIQPGGGSPLHRHPNCEEVLHMLRGEIDQVVEGTENLRMKAGDTITIPKNVKHCAINVGTEPAEMIVVFSSPERQTILCGTAALGGVPPKAEVS
jgi:quercetin dioxygenase-like cupin family protein